MKRNETSSGCWIEEYENLRRHFLEQPSLFGAAPFGLMTLMGKGLAGWMRQWIDASAMPPVAAATPPHGMPSGCVLPGVQLQLTLVLAQMTSAHLPTRVA